MSGQEKKLAQKRGRPATGAGKTIGVRLQPEDLAHLDQWIIEKSPGPLSRPAAIRIALDVFLERELMGPGRHWGDESLKPTGAATYVVAKMDAAIITNRRKR